MSQELAAGEIAHQHFVDRRALEAEVLDVLGQGQFGDGDLVLDRARLLLGNLGLQQVADDALGFVLALHRRRDDLVVAGLLAVELQVHHRGQDFGTLHHVMLLAALRRPTRSAWGWRSRTTAPSSARPAQRPTGSSRSIR